MKYWDGSVNWDFEKGGQERPQWEGDFWAETCESQHEHDKGRAFQKEDQHVQRPWGIEVQTQTP